MEKDKTEAETADTVTMRTSRFGEIEIPATQVIKLPQGLLGFPAQQHFALLVHKPGSPFFWLQSVEDPALAFVAMNPYLLAPDYKVDLTNEDRQDLQLSGEEPLMIYGLVTIPRGKPAEMTINLMGPLVINTAARVGKQLVLNNSDYSHRHPVLSPGAGSSQDNKAER